MEDFESGIPKPRRYRNHRLGDFPKELDLTEGKSTCITTVRAKLKSNGSPTAIYEFDEETIWLCATIKIYPEFLTGGISDGAVNGVENARTLAMKLSAGFRTIQRDLSKLQKEGYIRHVGSDKMDIG